MSHVAPIVVLLDRSDVRTRVSRISPLSKAVTYRRRIVNSVLERGSECHILRVKSFLSGLLKCHNSQAKYSEIAIKDQAVKRKSAECSYDTTF